MAQRSTLRLARLDDVLRWGWSGEALLGRLIDLDRRVIGDVLTDEREGTVAQWSPVFLAHPDNWVLLTKGPAEIVGYWHFVALRDEQFHRARAGELLDSEITVDDVQPLDVPGVFKLYFVLIGVLPDCPQGGQQLLDAFFDQLETLANRGTFFSEVCANAFTEAGKRLCEGFGMQPLSPHKDFGTMYWVPLHPWPSALRHKRWREVAEQYGQCFCNAPQVPRIADGSAKSLSR